MCLGLTVVPEGRKHPHAAKRERGNGRRSTSQGVKRQNVENTMRMYILRTTSFDTKKNRKKRHRCGVMRRVVNYSAWIISNTNVCIGLTVVQQVRKQPHTAKREGKWLRENSRGKDTSKCGKRKNTMMRKNAKKKQKSKKSKRITS